MIKHSVSKISLHISVNNIYISLTLKITFFPNSIAELIPITEWHQFMNVCYDTKILMLIHNGEIIRVKSVILF